MTASSAPRSVAAPEGLDRRSGGLRRRRRIDPDDFARSLEASVESTWPRSRTARAWSLGRRCRRPFQIERTAGGRSRTRAALASASAWRLGLSSQSFQLLEGRLPVPVGRLDWASRFALSASICSGVIHRPSNFLQPSFFQAASRDGSIRVTAVSWAVASAVEADLLAPAGELPLVVGGRPGLRSAGPRTRAGAPRRPGRPRAGRRPTRAGPSGRPRRPCPSRPWRRRGRRVGQHRRARGA